MNEELIELSYKKVRRVRNPFFGKSFPMEAFIINNPGMLALKKKQAMEISAKYKHLYAMKQDIKNEFALFKRIYKRIKNVFRIG